MFLKLFFPPTFVFYYQSVAKDLGKDLKLMVLLNLNQSSEAVSQWLGKLTIKNLWSDIDELDQLILVCKLSIYTEAK